MPHGNRSVMPPRQVPHNATRQSPAMPPRQAPHHATRQSPRYAAPASSAQCHMAIAPLCCPGKFLTLPHGNRPAMPPRQATYNTAPATPMQAPPKTKKDRIQSSLFARRHPESDRGMRILQTLALPLGYGAKGKWSGRRDSDSRHPPWQGGTLPLSYYRILRRKGQRRNKCRGAESNHRHGDFQSPALPSELPRHIGDQEGARTLDLQRDRLAF